MKLRLDIRVLVLKAKLKQKENKHINEEENNHIKYCEHF